MTAAPVTAFLELLKQDQPLAEKLRAATDPAGLDHLASDLARERGIEFTPAEFRAALDDLTRAAAGELSEEDLQAVSGGASALPVCRYVPGGASGTSAGCSGGDLLLFSRRLL